MRKIVCLLVVLAGLSLAGCDDVREYRRMVQHPPIDGTAALIVTFGVLAALLAARRILKRATEAP